MILTHAREWGSRVYGLVLIYKRKKNDRNILKIKYFQSFIYFQIFLIMFGSQACATHSASSISNQDHFL